MIGDKLRFLHHELASKVVALPRDLHRRWAARVSAQQRVGRRRQSRRGRVHGARFGLKAPVNGEKVVKGGLVE